MTKYKSLKGVAHNFTDSFIDYPLLKFFDSAHFFKEKIKFKIDFLKEKVEPKVYFTKVLEEQIINYKKWFKEQLNKFGIPFNEITQLNMIIGASFKIKKLDTGKYREIDYSCETTIKLKNGRKYKHKKKVKANIF